MRFRRIREFFRWFYRYRSIRLTPEGTRYVLLTLAVGVAAINTGNNLLYLLLAMLLSLIVMSGLLSEQCLKQLDIRRVLPEHVFANRPTTGAIAVANRKPRLATFSLKVMDVIENKAVDRGIHLLHLAPRASTLQSYPLLIARRGRYAIEGIKLLTRFPFGLFVKAATLPLPSEIVVYPEVKPLPEGLIGELTALGHEQAAFRRGPGSSLYNLRDYQAGDESRTIHWRTSARQARLIVKETEAEDQRRVTLALSTAVTDADQDAFEEAVSLTTSLALYFHEQGYAIGLLAGDCVLEPAIGTEHLYGMLRVLGLCRRSLVSGTGSVPDGFLTLGERTAQGELTMLILPWRDPALLAYSLQVSRVFQVSEQS
jgi:uncharacterized protein (DUF58 family)